MNTPETEIKIIEAAIGCIEKYGFREATVRRIAQEAGVNIAAINYHFHSKEQLMDRVMDITLENAFDWSHFASTEDAPPKVRLMAILSHIVEGALEYPEITRAHFITPLIERDRESIVFSRFLEFLECLYEDLKKRGAIAEPKELRTALLQAVTASILGIGLFGELLEGFAGFDLKNKKEREAYIERLVERVL
jgi:AcrR family transcriptional regulator